MNKLLAIVTIALALYYVLSPDSAESKDTIESSSLDRKIYLIGMNSYDLSILSHIEDNLEFLGYDCEISQPVSAHSQDCNEIQDEFGNFSSFYQNDGDAISVYFTDGLIYDGDKRVRGLCYGDYIYARETEGKKGSLETVVHELLHSYGLEHCENECVMNSRCYYRWDTINKKPILCDDCRELAPSWFK